MPLVAQDADRASDGASIETVQAIISPESILPVEQRAVQDVRVIGTAERARLIIDLNSPTEYSFVSIADPMAIAVDARAAGISLGSDKRVPTDGFIASFEVSQIAPDRVRTLIFLTAPAQVAQAFVLEAADDQPARLVIDLITDNEASFFSRAEGDRIASGESILAPENDGDDEQPAAMTEEAATSGVEIRPLILIDPGHGGIDGGATAANGLVEKDVTLRFANILREELIATGKVDVALSREDDLFLRLEERVQIARDNLSSLFISVHADAFEDPEIRGAALYTRDEQATDILDKVLADQENRADLIAGIAPPETDNQAVDILVDLMRREMRRQSFLAAKAIQTEMQTSVTMRRFSLRRADFFVLQAPDIPSILLELGFLSNGTDARNLANEEWMRRAAQAIARGVVAYYEQGGGK